jgi:hypothetical protein
VFDVVLKMARLREIMKRPLLAVLAASLPVIGQIAPAAAQQPPPATAQQLAAIAERGRALMAYDQAAWHGTDAAQAVAGNDTSGLQYYIARKTATGWVVDFGKLDPTGTAFLTTIEAVSSDGLHFTATRLVPSRSDAGFLPAAAHALATAKAVFKPVTGYRYNVAVLPNPDGTMYVYLYPAQTDPKIFPLGGDERFTLSADGSKILDSHRMHNGILARPADADVPAGAQLTAGFHTVVVENVPQDTDVFHVLTRKPSIPDYVDAEGQLYVINVDGSIEYKGPAPAKP